MEQRYQNNPPLPFAQEIGNQIHHFRTSLGLTHGQLATIFARTFKWHKPPTASIFRVYEEGKRHCSSVHMLQQLKALALHHDVDFDIHVSWLSQAAQDRLKINDIYEDGYLTAGEFYPIFSIRFPSERRNPDEQLRQLEREYSASIEEQIAPESALRDKINVLRSRSGLPSLPKIGLHGTIRYVETSFPNKTEIITVQHDNDTPPYFIFHHWRNSMLDYLPVPRSRSIGMGRHIFNHPPTIKDIVAAHTQVVNYYIDNLNIDPWLAREPIIMLRPKIWSLSENNKCDFCSSDAEDGCHRCDVSWCFEHRYYHQCDQSPKQPNPRIVLRQAIANLDQFLTGKVEFSVAQRYPANALSWIDSLESIVYLSDGGYSRIGVNLDGIMVGEQPRLYLTSNSSVRVKNRWESALALRQEVEQIITQELQGLDNE